MTNEQEWALTDALILVLFLCVIAMIWAGLI